MVQIIKKTVPLLLIAAACGVFVEIDISNEEILLVSPGEGTTVEGPEVTFSWEEVEGATGYEVRVVRPTFEAISELELDTVVGEILTLTTSLERGDYQWSARGVNGEYETEIVVRNFSVTQAQLDTLVRLRDKTIVVISPNDNSTVTESNNILFKWEEVDGAKEYVYRIYRDLNSDSLIASADDFRGTEFTRTIEQGNGDYRWEVRAKNDIDSTDVFVFKFKIDVNSATSEETSDQ